jgi:hypothetical protein
MRITEERAAFIPKISNKTPAAITTPVGALQALTAPAKWGLYREPKVQSRYIDILSESPVCRKSELRSPVTLTPFGYMGRRVIDT